MGLVGLDGGQRGLGVEAGQQRHVAALEQRRARPHDRPVVVERPGHDQPGAGHEAERRRPSGSTRAGSPDTISFGRPVEPPEVGAFHDGDTTSGNGLALGGAGSGR